MRKKTPYHKYLMNIRWSEEDECYVVEFPELPGCATHGDSMQEVLDNANDAVGSWLMGAKKSGFSIPEPVSTKKWSGTFTTRLEPEVHRLLAVKAKQAGKTLSKYIVDTLRKAVY